MKPKTGQFDMKQTPRKRPQLSTGYLTKYPVVICPRLLKGATGNLPWVFPPCHCLKIRPSAMAMPSKVAKKCDIDHYCR